MRGVSESLLAVVSYAPCGKIMGRERLHNIIYLLDILGFESSASFEYGSYGVYSRKIDIAIVEAVEEKMLVEQTLYLEHLGRPCKIYHAIMRPRQTSFGCLSIDQLREITGELAGYHITILELAVCIDWLWRHEKYAGWHSEIMRRKPLKVKGGRIEQAVSLLVKIGLRPPGDSSWRAEHSHPPTSTATISS